MVEEEQGYIEGAAGIDEARALVRRVGEEDAAFDTRLIGDDADGASCEAGKAGDQFGGKEFLDFEEAATIHERVDKVVHVEGFALRLRYENLEGAITGRWHRLSAGGFAEVVLGHVAEIIFGYTNGVLFALYKKVTEAGDGTVHACAAHLFERDLLACDHLGHTRGTEVSAGVAINHNGDVRKGGCVGRARRCGAKHDGAFRHLAGRFDLS